MSKKEARRVPSVHRLDWRVNYGLFARATDVHTHEKKILQAQDGFKLKLLYHSGLYCVQRLCKSILLLHGHLAGHVGQDFVHVENDSQKRAITKADKQVFVLIEKFDGGNGGRAFPEVNTFERVLEQ